MAISSILQSIQRRFYHENASIESLSKKIEKQTAEQAREHAHGEKEAGTAGNPALAVSSAHISALSAMTQFWSDETLADIEFWPDSGLVWEGLRLFHDLPRSASVEVLLATDMHAGKAGAVARY